MSGIKNNLHTHSKYCDGAGNIEEYIISAIEKKMSSLGFSGHAPVPFESWWNMSNENFAKYLSEISEYKAKYNDKIEIYCGVEADYLKNKVKPDDFIPHNLDYVIGAVHFLNIEHNELPWDFIISAKVFKDGLSQYYHNDTNRLISDYFEQINNVADEKSVDIIAHFNQINKFNKGNEFFNEKDKFYLNKVRESLEYIATKNKIIEVNTRGKFRNLSDEFYPSIEILKMCKQYKIPITLSADAHKPGEVNSLLEQAAEYAKQAGYKEYLSIRNKKFEPFAL